MRLNAGAACHLVATAIMRRSRSRSRMPKDASKTMMRHICAGRSSSLLPLDIIGGRLVL